MSEIDPRDRALQLHTPAVMVPRFSGLADLEGNGHRYLVAADGLWIEARRDWIHARWPLADAGVELRGASLPFGTVEPRIEMAFEWQQLVDLLGRFEAQAAAAMPDECAAWITWRAADDALAYRPLVSIAASPGGLEYSRPRLDDGEHVIADLHSHGAMEAFFSGTDDADDAGDMKYAGVLGKLGSDLPEWHFRLCMPGGWFVDETEWTEIPIEEESR